MFSAALMVEKSVQPTYVETEPLKISGPTLGAKYDDAEQRLGEKRKQGPRHDSTLPRSDYPTAMV